MDAIIMRSCWEATQAEAQAKQKPVWVFKGEAIIYHQGEGSQV